VRTGAPQLLVSTIGRRPSPCRSRWDDQMRAPLSHVPFDEPRSATHHPAAKRSSTACRWLAVGSSGSGTSFRAWTAFASRVAGSELTPDEWDDLLPDRRYRRTC